MGWSCDWVKPQLGNLIVQEVPYLLILTYSQWYHFNSNFGRLRVCLDTTYFIEIKKIIVESTVDKGKS